LARFLLLIASGGQMPRDCNSELVQLKLNIESSVT